MFELNFIVPYQSQEHSRKNALEISKEKNMTRKRGYMGCGVYEILESSYT